MWCNIPPASEHSDAVGAGEHLEIGTLEIEMNIFETNLNIYESRILQGDFFNWASPENVSRLAPPIPNTLTFSIPMGGQSGTLMFF